eukprot:CAMPEP_0198138882 /NCGR_PEP_ID=MMETSP1443-20131203/2268_1 /TAXON_ID=186043 /ORGANISM="Entomoneis sp., Strain CCMP2396" /LENGTH=188 /DNA_ID=CAMNT_0043800839 /DNA_START=106 /DNA_END=672 /DNA_ORIENTATION=+
MEINNTTRPDNTRYYSTNTVTLSPRSHRRLQKSLSKLNGMFCLPEEEGSSDISLPFPLSSPSSSALSSRKTRMDRDEKTLFRLISDRDITTTTKKSADADPDGFSGGSSAKLGFSQTEEPLTLHSISRSLSTADEELFYDTILNPETDQDQVDAIVQNREDSLNASWSSSSSSFWNSCSSLTAAAGCD